MRVLTGITPSGTLHIGNYYGAMRPAIELQAGGDAYYFIADYHSMTAITDRKERLAYTQGIAVAERRGDIQAAKEMRVFLKRLERS